MTQAITETRRVSPAEGRKVRHPGGAVLEPKSDVTWSAFWQRLLNDGDVVLVDDRKAEKKDA